MCNKKCCLCFSNCGMYSFMRPLDFTIQSEFRGWYVRSKIASDISAPI